MKKCKLLLLLSAVALTGCAQPLTSKTAGAKLEIKDIYNDAIDQVEALDDDIDSTTSEDSTDGTTSEEDTSSSEEVVEGNSSETTEDNSSEETTEEENTSGETEEDVEETVEKVSYHIDYAYDYVLKVTRSDGEVFEEAESEAYSFTYVKEGDAVSMELDSTHEYFVGGENYGTEKVHAVLQDNVFYVDVEVTFGEETYNEKYAYALRTHGSDKGHYKPMGDCVLLDPTSRDDNNSLIDDLLANNDVTVTDVDGNLTTVEFDYKEGVATMVFNTENNTFVSVNFDRTYIADIPSLLDEGEEVTTPEVDDTDDVCDNEGEHRHNGHGQGNKDKYSYRVDVYSEVIDIQFDYEEQFITALTEEEIANYVVINTNHGHHDDFEDFDDDFVCEEGKHESHGQFDKDWDHEEQECDEDKYDSDKGWGHHESEHEEPSHGNSDRGHGHGNHR